MRARETVRVLICGRVCECIRVRVRTHHRNVRVVGLLYCIVTTKIWGGDSTAPTPRRSLTDGGAACCRDYGYVGCVADVLAHLDSRCSGRRSCEIRIPDLTLDRANPCPKDFKTYLQAGYGCVKSTCLSVFGCLKGVGPRVSRAAIAPKLEKSVSLGLSFGATF